MVVVGLCTQTRVGSSRFGADCRGGYFQRMPNGSLVRIPKGLHQENASLMRIPKGSQQGSYIVYPTTKETEGKEQEQRIPKGSLKAPSSVVGTPHLYFGSESQIPADCRDTFVYSGCATDEMVGKEELRLPKGSIEASSVGLSPFFGGGVSISYFC
jgi:hypothetical protein